MKKLLFCPNTPDAEAVATVAADAHEAIATAHAEVEPVVREQPAKGRRAKIAV